MVRTTSFGDGYIYSIDMIFKFLDECPIKYIKYPIETFVSVLSKKYWGDPTNSRKQFGPADVLKDKEKYKDHYKRILDADLRYPILVNKKFRILDGVHRITKSFIKNKKYIKVRIVNDAILKLCVIGLENKIGYKKVFKLTPKQIEKIFRERRKKLLELCE